DQPVHPTGITRNRKDFSAGTHRNVQAVFRDVDTDSDDLHGDPSLPNRASLFAAQATVRVRWNGERGAELTYGLQRPRGLRTPARHRTRNLIRVAAMKVTRGRRRMRLFRRRPLTRLARQVRAIRPLPACGER